MSRPLELALLGERNPPLGAIPDDEMVMEPEIEQLGTIGELSGKAEILARRRRIAGRMIVHEDQRRRAFSESRTKYLAGMDKRGRLSPERDEGMH